MKSEGATLTSLSADFSPSLNSLPAYRRKNVATDTGDKNGTWYILRLQFVDVG